MRGLKAFKNKKEDIFEIFKNANPFIYSARLIFNISALLHGATVFENSNPPARREFRCRRKTLNIRMYPTKLLFQPTITFPSVWIYTRFYIVCSIEKSVDIRPPPFSFDILGNLSPRDINTRNDRTRDTRDKRTSVMEFSFSRAQRNIRIARRQAGKLSL